MNAHPGHIARTNRKQQTGRSGARCDWCPVGLCAAGVGVTRWTPQRIAGEGRREGASEGAQVQRETTAAEGRGERQGLGKAVRDVRGGSASRRPPCRVARAPRGAGIGRAAGLQSPRRSSAPAAARLGRLKQGQCVATQRDATKHAASWSVSIPFETAAGAAPRSPATHHAPRVE